MASKEVGEEETDFSAHEAGDIYTITQEGQSGDQDILCKVGRTNNLKRRLTQLQTGNPQVLDYYQTFSVSDMAEAEKRAHTAVSQYHTTGEWYQVPQRDMAAFMEAIASAARSY